MIEGLEDFIASLQAQPDEDMTGVEILQEPTKHFGECNPVYGKALLKDYKWVTDGHSSGMIGPDEVPAPGWYYGRPNPHKDVEQFRKQGLENNPNAKTYVVEYRDGTTESVHSLNTWARKNGYTISGIKAKVRKSMLNKPEQFVKPSATLYHIKSIKRV